jgi:hypothetical protein
MRLTSFYRRLAMPQFEICPQCGRKVTDFFFEWLLQKDQQKILRGEAAMDCPLCRRAVGYPKGTLIKPWVSLPILLRDQNRANLWAVRNGYPDLESFLTNPEEQSRAQPFRSGYWKEVRV